MHQYLATVKDLSRTSCYRERECSTIPVSMGLAMIRASLESNGMEKTWAMRFVYRSDASSGLDHRDSGQESKFGRPDRQAQTFIRLWEGA
jgi:hypothetical protein